MQNMDYPVSSPTIVATTITLEKVLDLYTWRTNIS